MRGGGYSQRGGNSGPYGQGETDTPISYFSNPKIPVVLLSLIMDSGFPM